MDKQELIKKYEGFRKIWNNPGSIPALECFLRDLAQLDEPQKPVIPQFVADWIEKNKSDINTLYNAYTLLGQRKNDVSLWVNSNQETFALAWIYGYTIEKTKLHIVQIGNVKLFKCVSDNHTRFLFTSDIMHLPDGYDCEDKLTEEEIKKYDERLWQFAKEVY